MFIAVLTLLTALSISAVAIYYSVAGLVAIFAAAALPIMIMGGTLEIAKLVTAVWLHRYWKQATWWLRTYLSTAVVVLMLITSMGIFGFLSKAHIEQTAASEESIAKVEVIENEIARQMGIVGRAENRIRALESSESNNTAEIQAQIDKEQERIDSAYDRIQPAIDEQNQIIADQTNLYSSQIEALDRDFNQLQAWINEGGRDNIAKVQGMVGTKPDGSWGFLTSNAVDEWRAENRAKREELVTKVEEIAQNNSTIQSARAEIQRLRRQAEDQINNSNTLINRLRAQLGNTDNVEDVQKDIDEQNERIKNANAEIDTLTEERIALEAEYRKLEAEVGPIKYIAEFIYGESADTNMLEEAVRWVIITIIFVFDPLAVLLLIASQYTFEWSRKQKEKQQKSNVVTWDDLDPEQEEILIPEEERKEQDVQPMETDDTDADATVGNDIPETDTTVADDVHSGVEQTEVQTDDTQEVEAQDSPKVDLEDPRSADLALDAIAKEYAETAKQDTDEIIDDLEVSADEKRAMKRWKAENPDSSLKTQRVYLQVGKISELPWEKYMDEKPGKTNYTEVIDPITYIENEDGEQVKKTAYKQNEEQGESSLWKRLKDGE